MEIPGEQKTQVHLCYEKQPVLSNLDLQFAHQLKNMQMQYWC